MACLGGGPSLTQRDVDKLRGRCHVIAINDAYKLAPWADLHYFADDRWWNWHKDEPDYRAFSGEHVTIESTGLMIKDPAVHILHNNGNEKLSEAPNGIHTGSNGGYQAVNIAVLTGALRILLLGYDMRYTGGRSHWHKGHPISMPESHYTMYARKFNTMLPQLKTLGVQVINCTAGSAINCFPIMDLDAALALQ